MSYTKGPWSAKHVSGSNFAVQEFDIRAQIFDSPHVVPVFNKNVSIIDGATVFVRPEDARLIAAAPDLLEAAEKLEQAECEGVDIPEICEKCFPLFGEARVLRRQAIAKARGKQS